MVPVQIFLASVQKFYCSCHLQRDMSETSLIYRVFFEFCLVRKANKNINLNCLFMDDTEFERGEKRLSNENGFILFF